MSESGGYQKMPPGWDCKYDQATGNCYYINYLTKAMQLEDPRGRSYRQLQNERCSTESIAMQQLVSQPQTSHNSSPYHVHPSNNLTAIRAFQERQQPTLHNVSTSPLLSASSRGHLEMSSPLPFQRARVGPNLSRRSTIQETSFTTQAETDAVVTKIQNMFPTAGENHIRLLLKRYMKNIFPKADEELLLDILANADNNVQFASEKLISLGYTKRDMQQPHRPNNRPPDLNQDQEAGGDQGGVHIPLRPKEYTEEEKTKMQTLLKEKYPQIAERIILMALESVNYAEDRATQILQIVQDEDEQRAQKQAPTNPKHLDLKKTTGTEQIDGANDKDSLPAVVEPTTSSKPKPPHKRHILPSINVTTPSTFTTQIILAQATPTPTPTAEETKLETHLSSISSASSSHSYASPAQSPRICQQSYERLTTKSILAKSGYNHFGHQSDTNNYSIDGYLHGSSNASSYSSYSASMTSSSLVSSAQSNSSSIARRPAFESRRTKTDSLKHRQHSLGNSHNSESAEFQSIIERMASLGPNSQLSKGADENLLLADYVTWNGPNTKLLQKQVTQGPDASLLTDRTYKPRGGNSELCKGPQSGLAKGSIYAQGSNKSPNIKCN
ncbi:uncharacterized protein LOC6738965 isoform X2 [Drosophila simulans]|uniref:Uncharacterized protein, isoform D n=1 Tax=Drosophila simulans TaxID=7240 RepID=A0A0J9S0M6_DROSI|nr:uncharacterized protein LOC6738965 isoform X2 [Drosophila simulans]KMZ00950.1 uncharacterized protein Dsimw501_GD14941, isoform D [Drosophila simulans]